MAYNDTRVGHGNELPMQTTFQRQAPFGFRWPITLSMNETIEMIHLDTRWSYLLGYGVRWGSAYTLADVWWIYNGIAWCVRVWVCVVDIYFLLEQR